jgi:O-antigen/teichoic acid export membrane protein
MKQHKQPWAFSDISLERSFLWSLAITILPVVASFIVSWVVARWSGPSVLGTVSWVMAFATTCLILGKFGVELAVSRLASEFGVNRPGGLRRLLWAGLQIRLSFTLPVALAALLFARPLAALFGDPELVNPIRVGSFVIACASLYEFKEHFLVGLNRFSTVYNVRFLYQSARVMFTTVIVLLGFGASAILLASCAAWCLGIVLYLMILARFLPPSDDAPADVSLKRQLFFQSIPLAVSGASVAIYAQIDKIMLGYFCAMDEVGQYTVARNVVEVSLFPVFAIIMTLRPALAARFSKGAIEDCSNLIMRTLYISLISGGLFATIFAVFGKSLVVFVFSARFEYAGMLMFLFLWIIVMRSLGAVILPALIAADKTKTYAYLTLGSAALNFGLNMVFIPSHQARGAIFATIISYGFLLISGLYFVVKTFTIRVSGRHVFLLSRIAAAGVIAIVLFKRIFPVPTPQASILLLSFLLAGFYALLLLMLRVIAPRDLKNIKRPFTL